MSRVEGERFTNAPSANPDEVNQTQVNQIEVDKTEQQRLVDAFWEIYDNNNQDEIDRQALCEHIYGILFVLIQLHALMQWPVARFYVNQERKVVSTIDLRPFTIDLRPNKANPTFRLVSVETNEEFEVNLKLLEQKLQTNRENFERQKQKLVNELGHYDLAVQQILTIVQGFTNGSQVKEIFLGAFDYSNTYLQRLREQKQLQQKLLEKQEQVVEKAKLAKEIGDSLLKQIKKRNST